MEDWMSTSNTTASKCELDHNDCLSGYHRWYATSHARPTYCNVCRDALTGVTSHGLSCEVCKCKVHKRCAQKAINNCKWTTLSSVGKEIIEEKDGTITMPHQWMEGNLPVSAKCSLCDKNCGSVLRLQDWRCLWCRATVHTQCRPQLPSACPLGIARVSVVPPTALHSIQDEAWEAVRPQASSPLLVFVNSKSGDNQGVKFLRRFKQLLNPAQVFDLILTGPRLGLRLFRHFDPFRILVCSGDGSVGWVLSEVDKLDLHKQCQIAVLPLGTGNDLARVLGWGSSCDDEANLPHLLEKYEKASTKILDRWSVMAFERTIAMPKLSLIPGQADGVLHSQIAQYEETLVQQLQNILQSDETTVIFSSVKRLCDTVKDLIIQVTQSSLTSVDEQLPKKCENLQIKLDMLLQALSTDQADTAGAIFASTVAACHSDFDEEDAAKVKEDTESEVSFEKRSEKSEKDLSNINFRKHRRTSRFVEKEKNALISRTDSLKRAIQSLVAQTEAAAEEHSRAQLAMLRKSDNNDVNMTMNNFSERSSCTSPLSQTSTNTARLVNLSPLPDIRRDSALDYSDLMNLPVPPDFADSRRTSQIQQNSLTITDELLNNACASLALGICAENLKLSKENVDCETLAAGNSNDLQSFCPLKDADGQDLNGHIGHIDSPETDTLPNSEAMHGESLMDDLSSILVDSPTDNEYGFDFDGFDMTTDNFESEQRHTDNKCFNVPLNTNTQFGFENPVFMAPNQGQNNERYCSLAQFVEGSDIARRSFKRNSMSIKKNHKSQINYNRQSTEVAKDVIPQVCVVVEPPSPEKVKHAIDDVSIALEPSFDLKKLLSNADVASDASNSSSTCNLLRIDNEHFLLRSPAATRRISCCSMLNPTETAALAAAAAASMMHDPSEKRDRRDKERERDDKGKANRKLPIINPLVRLPTWPNVSTGTGFIGKCLLANADTLCAAVSPLIDPDETLMQGFFERCVMNNYFGIGIDAKISLDFHQKREEHPEKCRSRAKNYMWYGVLGSKQLLQKRYKNLEQRVQLECDGQRIPLPHLQGIVILNIPSFMGGINFWGGSKEDDLFLAPSFDDKILEVVAVFGSVQMAASRLINLQQHRIAQCQSVQINILGDEGVPIQVDGEAWIQPPGIIRILHKNRMQMLARNRSLENSLRTWEEKRQSIAAQGASKHRASVPHDKSSRFSFSRPSIAEHEKHSNFIGKLRQHSFSGSTSSQTTDPQSVVRQPTVTFSTTCLESPSYFTDDEHLLLLRFIECTTGMIKWIKIFTISNQLDVDLYSLAVAAEDCLECIHPGGKILAGPLLRPQLTKLVNATKTLHEECCSLLREQSDKLNLREDLKGKLCASLASMDLEFRKCLTQSTSLGKLVYLQALQELDEPKRRSGLLWTRLRKASTAHLSPNSHSQRDDVASWGTHEVGTWLETLQLSEYIDSFVRNDIRGRELLNLARRDLKDLGVTKVGHIKRILQAIKELSHAMN